MKNRFFHQILSSHKNFTHASLHLILSSHVSYIRLDPCTTLPLNSQRALDPGTISTTPVHHYIIGNAYSKLFTHERSLSQANAHTAYLHTAFPVFHAPRFPLSASIPGDYVRPQPRLATFVKMFVRATPAWLSRTSFELPCQSLIARKYTAEEQFGPAVESVLWV